MIVIMQIGAVVNHNFVVDRRKIPSGYILRFESYARNFDHDEIQTQSGQGFSLELCDGKVCRCFAIVSFTLHSMLL